jgi:hypothetical protein
LGPDDEARMRASSAPQVSAWMFQALATQVLRETSQRCHLAGIEFVAVKGVVTGRWLYDDPAKRPITDIDIRIRSRDVSRFRRMATKAGWRCLRDLRAYRSLVYDHEGWSPLTLDVECEVGPPGLCGLRVDDMLARAEPLERADGLTVLVPEVHDHALLLTVNAFKDKIVDAFPYAREDLSRVVRHRDFHFDTFVDRAIRSRAVTITWIVGSWMDSHGHTEWGPLLRRLEDTARVRRGYARIFNALMEGKSRSLAMRLFARAGADAP